MFRKLWLPVWVCALVVCAGRARAADTALTGRWVSDTKDRHVEMDFTNDGKCHIKCTDNGGKKGKDKTTKVDGAYEMTSGRLVVQANDRKPIVYSTNLQGDTLTLSGGWPAIAQPVTLTKKAADVPPPPAPAPMPKEAPPAPQKPQDAPKADKADGAANTTGLPGGNWDISVLEQSFTVLKVKADPNANTVTWLLEKKVDGFLSLDASYYDEDDVKLGTSFFTFEPSMSSVAKGERTRGTVTLLKEEDMKKSKKVIITKR